MLSSDYTSEVFVHCLWWIRFQVYSKKKQQQQQNNKIICSLKLWASEEILVIVLQETSLFSSICKLSDSFVGGYPCGGLLVITLSNHTRLLMIVRHKLTNRMS